MNIVPVPPVNRANVSGDVMGQNLREVTNATVTRIASAQEPAAGTTEHSRWELAREIVAQRATTRKFTLFPRAGSLDKLSNLLEKFEEQYGHDGTRNTAS